MRSSRATDIPFKAARVPDDSSTANHLGEDDIDDGEDPDDAPEATPVREGLPPSYRMRHEPHYVETLVAPSVVAAAPAPPLAPSPALDAPVRTPFQATGAVAQSLVDALTAIHGSLSDVSMSGRSLRDRVAIDVARAEAARALWLADAALALHSDPLPALDEVDMAQVLRSVGDTFSLERRLTGEGPRVTPPSDPCRVFGDERLLTAAIGGLLGAMRALVDGRGDQGKVSVSVGERLDVATRTVVVTQAAVRVQASVFERFFDAEWLEHPAGRTGALLLAAAQRIATAHGGSLDVGAIDGGGFRLSFSVPAVG